MSKDKKLKVSVVFDSNLLGGHVGVVPKEISQIAQKSKGYRDSDFDVKLYASDVVFEELCNHFYKHFQKLSCSHDERVSSLNTRLNFELTQIGSLCENETRKSFEKMWGEME